MKKKGFTLIELLAVIVVLAIIALIATPIVMNTIKNAKKGSAERGAENYIDAVETAIATSKLDNKDVADGTYQITNDGNLCRDKSASCSDEDKIFIEMNGEKPKSGSIVIKNGQVTTDSSMTIGDYTVSYNPTTKKYEATENSNTPQPTKTYTNGEVVYFNVTTGEKCSDYTESQSNIGVKEGCMKFYAFNDDGGDTVNLILDHNTTAMLEWVSQTDYVAAGGTESDYGDYGKNDKGPITLLAQLKNDTSSWKGTITPANYTMDQTGQKSNAKYTIDYSDYKARLITANEIAEITGNTTYDEKTASSEFYFDTNINSESDTCKRGNTTGCKYGWLYDRTNTECTMDGCLNNSNQATYGYWTASSHTDYSNSAINVAPGFLSNWEVCHIDFYGVRPVITVAKSNLS